MPRYRARYFGELRGTEPNSIRRIAQGEEFDFDGPPGLWMEPVAEAAPIVDNGEPEVDTMYGLAEAEARRQRNAQAVLEGKQPEVKRGPGRPPKSSYSSS